MSDPFEGDSQGVLTRAGWSFCPWVLGQGYRYGQGPAKGKAEEPYGDSALTVCLGDPVDAFGQIEVHASQAPACVGAQT